MPRNPRTATDVTPAPTPFVRLAALCEVSAIRSGKLSIANAYYLRLCLKLYPEEFATLLPQQEQEQQVSADRN